MAPLNLPQFTVVTFLPISPVLVPSTRNTTTTTSPLLLKKQKQPSSKTEETTGNARQSESGLGASASILDFFLKLACLATVLATLRSDSLHRLAREALYAIGLYLFIAVVMNAVSVITILVLNLKVAPHFDKPFLSSSLTEFWSRRWNLNTGFTLRFSVYDPICEGRLVKKDKLENLDKKTLENSNVSSSSSVEPTLRVSTTRRSIAVCASFIASGLLHEAFIIYLRGRVSGYWLAFFSVQGPLLVAESVGRRWLRTKKIVIPQFLAIPVALGVMLTVGDVLFFPDIVRMGIVRDVVDNLTAILVW